MKTNLISRSLSIVAIALFPMLSFAQNDIQNYRPYDQRGLNIFETPKSTYDVPSGFKVRIGGNFTQQFQALDHENNADFVDKDNDGVSDNQLIDLTNGFNLATANLNIDAQLDDGIRVNIITYMSSRHHPEGWVKGGYIQFDKLPFLHSSLVDRLMENLTIKAGHMEVNYGDAHFRRSDNGATMFNPFVENYIMDAFNTEIGMEVIFQKNGFLAVGSVTGGEIKGDVVAPVPVETDPDPKKSPSWIGKIGFDKQLSDDFRLRLTGSIYYTGSSARNLLYGGDRTGSRYYLVMENTKASTSSNFTSGRFNPVFTDQVTALMGNIFLKYKGIEFFGTYENANGRTHQETDTRNASQVAADLILRFGSNENFFVGGRYNTLNAELIGSGTEVTINRLAISAGWYMTPNILAKIEYVNQEYKDFPSSSIFAGGKFNGLMIEAAVGF